MTDRELLELAAKAAGYGEVWYLEGYDTPYIGPKYVLGETVRYAVFDPFNNDGDALRLFCALPCMCIETSDVAVTVRERERADGRVHWMFTEWLAKHGDDPLPATRRAIVRAAAEIGRAMP